jgi:hypothetical protein
MMLASRSTLLSQLNCAFPVATMQDMASKGYNIVQSYMHLNEYLSHVLGILQMTINVQHLNHIAGLTL